MSRSWIRASNDAKIKSEDRVYLESHPRHYSSRPLFMDSLSSRYSRSVKSGPGSIRAAIDEFTDYGLLAKMRQEFKEFKEKEGKNAARSQSGAGIFLIDLRVLSWVPSFNNGSPLPLEIVKFSEVQHIHER